MVQPRSRFVLRFVLPASAAVACFVAVLFLVFIPAFERAIMERKREMIRELANVAWSTIQRFALEEQHGRMTQAEAQREAVKELRQLRYGPEGKDYYWIIDSGPRMVMHPYVPELEGADLREFKDPHGTRLFVEQRDATEGTGAAYVTYIWQWKDDASRQVPKLSYVRRFQPWGWIVGTGLYVEDVRREIRALEHRLLVVSGGITLLVGLLLSFLGYQGRRSEALREEAEAGLRESEARYRTLVRSSTEGLLMIREGRPVYANQALADLLLFDRQKLSEHSLSDLLSTETGEILERLQASHGPEEWRLRRLDGSWVDAVVTVSRGNAEDEIVVTIRDVSTHKAVAEALQQSRVWFRDVADRLDLGVFRATWGRRWHVTEANDVLLTLLDIPRPRLPELDLLTRFRRREDASDLLACLERGEAVKDRLVDLEDATGQVRAVHLSLVRVRDDQGMALVEGLVEDASRKVQEADAQAQVLEDLQRGQHALNQPLALFLRPVPTCGLDASIHAVSRRMVQDGASAMVVCTPEGQPCGIVTDHDLRARIMAEGKPPETQVYQVMSAPLVSLPATALLVEALAAMEARHLTHLLVVDGDGRVLGLLDGHTLLSVYRHLGELVLAEVAQAPSPEAFVVIRRRVATVVRGLVASGIRGRHVGRFLSALADAAMRAAVSWAEQSLGPAPGSYALVALGSHGRGEMTLGSDQDHALIFAEGLPEEAPAYFLALGQRVSDYLEGLGYPRCPGGVMASEPLWNASLEQWKRQFARWVAASGPQDLLEVHICFDLRLVAGEPELVDTLRDFVRDRVKDHPAFLSHLAQNALQTKSLVRKLGGAVAVDAEDRVDLKQAMAQLVNALRIYALRAGLKVCNTVERLEALRRAEVRFEADHRNLLAAHELLLSLRIRNQTEGEGGNSIDLKRMDELEAAAFKRGLQQVELLRTRLSFDFLGRS